MTEDEMVGWHHRLNEHEFERKWQPTPVFLPGESQGRRSLVGCRLWGAVSGICGFFQTMHGDVSVPSCCVFMHPVLLVSNRAFLSATP